jgi:hypothetical protein
MYISKVMLLRAPRMAASISGKISSPLTSARARFPGTSAGPRHHAHRANELGIADAVERPHAGVDLLVAEREVGRGEHREPGGEERQDPDAPGGVAPPAHRA